MSSRLQLLEALRVYDLPDDYYSRYMQAILAVSSIGVRRVAQQYIEPDRLTTIIVGDREAIEPRTRALNLGSITEVTVDQVFAPAK